MTEAGAGVAAGVAVAAVAAGLDLEMPGNPLTPGIIIGAVRRSGDWEIAMGDTHVQAGDKIIGICK